MYQKICMWFLGTFFFVAATVCGVFLFSEVQRTIQFLHSDLSSVQGIAKSDLIKIDSTCGGKGGRRCPYYQSVYMYVVNGVEYELIAKRQKQAPIYSAGVTPEILFVKGHPTNARINNFYELWNDSIGLSVLFLILSIIGYGSAFLYIQRRIKKKRDYILGQT